MAEPSDRDVRRIAAEADVDVRTVRRVLVERAAPRSRATHRAIADAITTLGLSVALPPFEEERGS